MTYLIRNIPPALWLRFKVRAAQDRVAMRTVLLRLLQNYCAEPSIPGEQAPPFHVPEYARGEHPDDH